MEASITPSVDQMAALTELPMDRPFVMINLLKYKDQVEGTEQTGKEMYGQYMQAMVPLLKEAGAELLWKGSPQLMLIAPEDEIHWDAVILVKYPSIAQFMEMFQRPDYPRDLRIDSLADSRLMACPAE